MFRFYPSRYRHRIHTAQKKIWEHFTKEPEHQWHLDSFGPLSQVAEAHFQPATGEVRESPAHHLLVMRQGKLRIEIEGEPLEMNPGDVFLLHGSHIVQTGVDAASWVEFLFEVSTQSPGPVKRNRNWKKSRGTLLPLASGHEDAQDALPLPFDATIYLSTIRQNEHLAFETIAARRAYVMLLEGAVRSGEVRLLAGDRMTVQRESIIPLTGQETSQLLLIDLP